MSFRPLALSLAIAGLAALMAVVAIAPAAAHERRQVGGLWMVVGWKNEPALLDQPNALDLRVYRLKDGVDPAKQTADDRIPIEGLDKTLKAEVSFSGGGDKMPLTLKPRFRDPGAYDGLAMPTKAGDYTFRVFGAVEGKDVNESFTSGPGTFGTVEDLKPLQFPVKLTPNVDLTARVEKIEAQLNQAGAKPAASSPVSAAAESDGDADTTLPTVLAVLALVASVGAAGMAGVSLRRGK